MTYGVLPTDPARRAVVKMLGIQDESASACDVLTTLAEKRYPAGSPATAALLLFLVVASGGVIQPRGLQPDSEVEVRKVEECVFRISTRESSFTLWASEGQGQAWAVAVLV